MAVEEVRYNVNELLPGVFVCRLEGRAWEGTPFPLQGIMLRTVEDIILVRRFATCAFIDRIRSVDGSPEAVLMSLDLGGGGSRLAANDVPATYRVTASLDEELPRIRFAANEAQKLSRRLIAITRMTHGLGMRAVAEGVEDETMLGAVLEAGCDFAQGYFFARSAPAAHWIATLH